MNVEVLTKDGQKLMPTTVERANKLLSAGEAELVDTFFPTIRMLKNTKDIRKPG